MKLQILICAFACLKDPDDRFGFGKGGESGLGWNMILQISKLGEVSVLTDSGNRQEIEEKMSESKLSNVSFYYISLPRFLSFTKKAIQIYAYLWQIKAYFIAKKLNKKIHFDVFHHITYANDWMASYIGALLPVEYIRGPGGGAHRVPESFTRGYSFKQRIAEKMRSVGQWLFRRDPFFTIGQNKAKALLVCNNEAFDALSKKWQRKACFFPVNGVTSEDLKLEYKKEDFGRFKIVSAGKLLKIKGFDLAIRAFKIFNDKIPQSELIVAGDGPEMISLKNLAEKLEIKNNVIFKKWLTHESLLREMASADVFLFCSLRDGGGQVVVEAMAAGKPVVCFDIAGPGFHVDENCGIKVKPKNPERAIGDIERALEKLYSDPELRIRLGKGARRKAELEYAWDELGGRLKKIYQKILKNGK